MMYCYIPPTTIGIPEGQEEMILRVLTDPYLLAVLPTINHIPLVSVHDCIALDSLTWVVFAVSKGIPLIRVAFIDEFREHETYREQWVRNRRGENEQSDIRASLDSRNPLRYS